MTRLLCALFGHKYRTAYAHAPKHYACIRYGCGEPGFLVPHGGKR